MDPTMLMQNPQLMAALGMRPGMTPGAPGMPTGMAPLAPQAPQAPVVPTGQAPLSSPSPGPASSPGLMPGPSQQTQPGSNPNIPRMAGDSTQGPVNREPTGENPQRPTPHNALPKFPRNNLGALLMPQGVVGGNAANPTPAFNMNNLLGQFLQRTPGSPVPSVSGL